MSNSFMSLGDSALLLNSSDDGIDLADYVAFDANECQIFADKVRVSKDLSFGSKQITIYCLKFEIEKSKLAKDDAGKPKPITLSLQGKDGDKPAGRQEGHEDLPPGGNGGNGGSFSLVVWEGLDSLIHSKLLTINVTGGKGHDGDTNSLISNREGPWNDISLYPPGGKGGNGGNGGSVTVSVPAVEISKSAKLKEIVDNVDITWPEKMDQFNSFLQDLKTLDLSLKDTSAAVLSTFETSLVAYRRYAEMCQNLASAIAKVTAFNPSSQHRNTTAIAFDAIATAKILQAFSQNVLQAKKGPDFVLESISAAFDAVAQGVADWLNPGGPKNSKALQDALAKASAEVMAAGMNVSKSVRPPNPGTITQLLKDVVDTRSQAIKDLCKLDGGGHGTGGPNNQYDFGPWPKADDGSDGKMGTSTVSYLDHDANVGDVKSNFIYDFPDICQKLLETAESLASKEAAYSRYIWTYFRAATNRWWGGVGRPQK